MIVRVCQWELSPLTDSVLVPLILSDVKAGLFIQSFGDTHCMKILSAFFFLFLLHIFFFFFLFNNCGVQECFHVGTFPFKGGIIFPQIKATASLPRASSLGCFVLLSRILKSAALFAPSLPSPFTSARLRFRPSTVTCFILPSCFPSSSVRCH